MRIVSTNLVLLEESEQPEFFPPPVTLVCHVCIIYIASHVS